MIRAGLLTLAILALPATATAHCGSTQGSFAVTCESGVKVYRHTAPSSQPRGLSASQTQLKLAKIRQETAQQRIAADRQTQMEQAELRRQEIENERYRNRILAQRNLNRIRGYGPAFGFGNGYFGGYTLARPIRVRKTN